MEDKHKQILEIISQWVEQHQYGDLCILIKCHQGKAVGVEEVREKTNKNIFKHSGRWDEKLCWKYCWKRIGNIYG